ncbi:cupredoxin domain-containing protein [Algiphilus aromaticivorans]|uniref:cupredoxin domain-containing protein n=1 Tax=Algiphilus aromaticivorans TaxID=382454 RepID=UPI000A07929E|nr:plastocyanin/azurin family copper-binding protein [Algiphilus aromaticivorans]
MSPMTLRHLLQPPTMLAAALLFAVAPIASGAEDASPPPEGSAKVDIVDFMRFDPEVLEVTPGTTVVWTNYDGSNHKVTLADGTKSGRLHMESTWSHTFDEPGTYEYHCSMHPRMKGTIEVKAP